MKSIIFLILFFSAPCLFGLPNFPGAEGYGTETPGGRGGKVLIVTNLNASGPGSLRDAMLTTGPRIIVFRVSGVIDFQSGAGWSFEAENLSYLTVAGQTSPGGITLTAPASYPYSLINQYTNNRTHDLVFRFLRFRSKGNHEGAIQMYRTHHLVFDHCDFSGGVDECTDVAFSDNITFQWCVTANSGPTGQVYGTLISYSPFVTMHHNLWAHHVHRAPLINWLNSDWPNNGMVDVRNNVMYDIASGHYFTMNPYTFAPAYTNAVGNYIKQGPSIDYVYPPFWFDSGIHAYEHDNHWESPDRASVFAWSTDTIFDIRYGREVVRVSTPFSMAQVTTVTAKAAYDLVLDKAGAWPRDAMNIRTINDVRNGTGVLGKVDDALITTGPAAPPDADMDGMPDAWEAAAGLNPGSASDNITDRNGDGYTNIEEYINCLADSLTGSPCPSASAVEFTGKVLAPRSPLSISPNPFTGNHLTITISGKYAPSGWISVVNAAGGRVAQFPASERLVWDGKADNGIAVSPGVYFVRWTKANKIYSQKRVIIIH